MTNETKTGLFFIFGLLLLGLFTFKVEDVNKWLQRRYTLVTFFDHAQGLEVGDPVAAAGVNIGQIQRLELVENRVRVTMQIDAHRRLYPGAKASIQWAGLLGRKYLDLTLGDSKLPPLKEGDVVPSEPSLTVGEVMDKIQSAAIEMSSFFTGESAKAFKDVGPKLSRALDGLVALSEDLQKQESTVRRLTSSDELYRKINDVADQLREGARSFNDMANRLDQRLAPVLQDVREATPGLKDAVTSLRRVADELEKGEGTIPRLIRDPELYKSLKETADNLRTFSERLEKSEQGAFALLREDKFARDLRTAADQLGKLAENLNQGEGTIPKLLRDDEIYRDLKRLISDAQEAIRGVKEQIPIGTFVGVLFSAF